MIWKFLINVRQRSLGKTVYCGSTADNQENQRLNACNLVLLPEYVSTELLFDFCQAVHRNSATTNRKVKVLQATVFLAVLQVHMNVSLLEAGITGTLSALFQYFWQECITDKSLLLCHI
ncbi:hypothetical protein T4B_3532 [Trichinella pseudospiralis]|uniref:Uncharacterized protein n=1 Tax=Trichinella pseudospiralis TaxID=6337 RepID=A0A0V1IYH3_TRIPS|nr:hypothetical protein T4B_3532 [Trichinella pseudospiralis]KRZ39289.1 hypothetical protein T4C_4908 [Trichinella pseudospiralis]